MGAKLPNFLIVGAAKSGTTSLYHYLKQHPEIYIPNRKECRYFSQMPGNFKGPKDDEVVNKTIIKSLDEYKGLFQDVSNEKAIGDMSPDYLYYYVNSIKNIRNICSDNVKIIIILRNPVERTYSHYLHYVRSGREGLSFEDALAQEELRKNKNWEWAWFYKDVSFYYEQVKAYLENFNQVKIYLFEDLKFNKLSLMRSMFRVLNVDESFVPDTSARYNVSGAPKNKFIHGLLYKPNLFKTGINAVVNTVLSKEKARIYKTKLRVKMTKKAQIKPETKEYLKNLYQKNILKLQDLIGRDLSVWLG